MGRGMVTRGILALIDGFPMRRYTRGILAVVAAPVLALAGALLGLAYWGLVELPAGDFLRLVKR
jgi:uncharacterized membrane protein (Fun14 family)